MTATDTRHRRLAASTAAVLAALALTACTPTSQDAPSVPPAPGAVLIPSPLNGWDATVYSFCDHGHRVYQMAYGQGGGLALVPNDPSCAAGVAS